MTTESQLIVLLTILVIFTINGIVRRRQATLRPLSAVAQLKSFVGESIEASRPLHLSLGNTTIGGGDTLLTLVGADFLYSSARQLAIGDTPPIVTTSETASLSIGRDILRRAYAHTGRIPFRPLNVRWFPAGGNGIAFAGAVTALQKDDKLAGNVLVGNYGSELALILWASQRHKRANIAHSARLEGQAVAFAMADSYLLGEELFAVSGYTIQDSGLVNRVVVMDVVRFLMVLVLLIVFVITLARGI